MARRNTHAGRVLVTGGAGFIGSHLLECLAASGRPVRAFIHYNGADRRHNIEKFSAELRDSIEIVCGDIIDPFAVNQAVEGCDVVCHLAALIGIPYSYQAPASYVNTNVVGTLNVLQACIRHRVRRLVHTSTSEVYGTAQTKTINERHPLVGQSPYAATKIAADKLVESFNRSFALPAVTIRPFNTYGPRQSARAAVPTIIAQALVSDRLRLGNLDPVRDLTYVQDTARAFVAAIDAVGVEGMTINLGVGQGISIRDLVERVGRLLGRKLTPVTHRKRIRSNGSEVMRLVSDNRLASEVLGWRPQIGLDEGLENTIRYVQTHLHEYRPAEYGV